MKRTLCLRMVILLLFVCLLPAKTPAQTGGPIISNGDAALIIGGIAAAGAAIGIVIYYSFNHSHSIRGCAVSGPNGLVLQNEGDQKTFQLLGITADVKPGDRVRITGKKKKLAKGASGNPTFLVEKLAKDYGACKAAAAKP